MISLSLWGYFPTEFNMHVYVYIFKLTELQDISVVFFIVIALVRYMTWYSTVTFKTDQEKPVLT